MTITQFIEKAEEGGWDVERADVAALNGAPVASIERAILDPEAWKAVGKVEGWGITDNKCNGCGYGGIHGWLISNPVQCPECRTSRAEYTDHMHRMIDALAEGKTIEQFIETL